MSGNVVHIRRPLNGLIGYGRSRPKPKRKFHENLRGVFKQNIIDPLKLTPSGFKNTCVIVNIILKLEYIMRGNIFTIELTRIKKMLQSVNLGNIDVIGQGITIEQFSDIENMDQLFKFLQKQYWFLRKYKGLSLNIFSCNYSNTLRSFSLVPIKLSKRWNQEEDFFSIDLLRDSEDIRTPLKKKRKKNNDKQLHQYQHTLLITNIFKLLHSFKDQNHNTNRLYGGKVCRRYAKSMQRERERRRQRE